MDPVLVALAVGVLVLAIVVVIALMRQSELVGQVRQLAETVSHAQAELGKLVGERLDAVSGRLGESLAQEAERGAKTWADVQSRLAVIDAAQRDIGQVSAQLAGQVNGLQDILDNKQARGAFGEVQLETIVRDVLPAAMCEFQATLGTGVRPDCLIRLPAPVGPVAIDAKFPLESYRAMVGAGDDAGRQQAAKTFAADIRKHIDDVAGKYVVPGETAEFALIFLPSEAIYAWVQQNLQSVTENARRRQVLIVSPTTLLFTLFAFRAVAKDAHVSHQAGEIQAQVALLGDDIKRLTDRVDNLRRHFEQATRDIHDIDVSARKVGHRIERVEAIQLGADTESGENRRAIGGA